MQVTDAEAIRAARAELKPARGRDLESQVSLTPKPPSHANTTTQSSPTAYIGIATSGTSRTRKREQRRQTADTAALREELKRNHQQEERRKQHEQARDRRMLKVLQKNYQDKLRNEEAMAAQERADERRRALMAGIHGNAPGPSYGNDHVSSHNTSHGHMGHVRHDSDIDPALATPPSYPEPVVPSSRLPYEPHMNQTRPTTYPPTPMLSHVADASRNNAHPAGSSTASGFQYATMIPLASDPSLDPREIMAKPELMAVVIERGMSKNREKETKGLLARRLREHDLMAPMHEIEGWLRRRGLSTKGNRAEMIWRLAEYDARTSRSWRPKHMAILRKARDAVKSNFAINEPPPRPRPSTPRPRPTTGASAAAMPDMDFGRPMGLPGTESGLSARRVIQSFEGTEHGGVERSYTDTPRLPDYLSQGPGTGTYSQGASQVPSYLQAGAPMFGLDAAVSSDSTAVFNEEQVPHHGRQQMEASSRLSLGNSLLNSHVQRETSAADPESDYEF